MSVEIRNEAISASAGSGKTFALAHRYIRLLANGVKPGRISALTFSRKAAGEIFDSIVRYLSEAAVSPERALETGARIEKQEFTTGEFLRLLRGVLADLNRLNIGTLDSFTVNIIRMFPMELGVSPDFLVMDNEGAGAEGARREVLSEIFSRRKVRKAAQRRFLEAFKNATFGQAEKALQRSLDKFTGVYHGYYQVLPERDRWGEEKVIWPGGSPWLTEACDVGASAVALERLLAADGLPEKVMARWRTFLGAVRVYGFGSPWSADIKYMFGKLIEEAEGLREGRAVIGIEKKECALSPEECRAALELLTHIVRTELRSAMMKTRGIYAILDQYEQLYDGMIRRQGKLTFDDVQYLLTESNRHSGGALISRDSRQQARLYIDYRLDCRLDHWLLDEFQDTSDLQWEVLRNLIDEILQDASGRRSFFYVGDVKQAIYGWRGGNYRLFGNILKRYGGRIEESPLDTSFRSCRPVIDTVNAVFGNLPEGLLPPGALAEWKSVWRDHRCRDGVVPESGCAALLEPPCCDGGRKPAAEDRYGCVASLLKEIDPPGRGLSAAVLVRSNKSGKEIVDFLRRECGGMPIVHEGKAVIKDNPVVSVLLSLVRFAAHPGDTFAWRHLEMSPLGEYLPGKGPARGSLPRKLLRRIQESGFHPFIREWGGRLAAAGALDDFGRKRLNDLAEAAIEFDAEGCRDCGDFLRFIDNYEICELAAGNAVRVMTIHQSKGLGFDIVVLPDLHEHKKITGAHRIEFVTARDPETTLPAWSLKMPRRVMAERDPVLAAELESADESAAFENLCVLYVALTRARQGLYMVTSYPGKNANAVRSDTLVKLQLAGDPKPLDGERVRIAGGEYVLLYEAGERDWHVKAPPRERPESEMVLREPPEGYLAGPSRRRRLRRVSPSARARERQSAASLFAPSARAGLDFGSAVHELFKELSWVEETDIDVLTRSWLKTSKAPEEVGERAVEQFRRALESAEVGRALSRPGGDVELWREKRFDIVMGDRWVTGAFDRVTITRAGDGKPVKATILDYKSDGVAPGADLSDIAERYRPQLELYRSALSSLLNLSTESIETRLLFTQPGRIFRLERAARGEC